MEEILARAVQIFLALAGAYLVALWFALAVWAYRDVGSRSQSVVTQVFATLLVVLFSIPGALLYLLLRPKETLDETYQRSLAEEYLLQDLEEQTLCHSCQRQVEDDFITCPNCLTTLREPCRACGRLLSVLWSVCPYCGEDHHEAALAIREQVRPPDSRWIARGTRTFRPLGGGSMTEVRIETPNGRSEAEETLTLPAPDGTSGVSPSLAGGAEPVRLFDRRRTRETRELAEKTAGETANSDLNGASAEAEAATIVDGSEPPQTQQVDSPLDTTPPGSEQAQAAQR